MSQGRLPEWLMGAPAITSAQGMVSDRVCSNRTATEAFGARFCTPLCSHHAQSSRHLCSCPTLTFYPCLIILAPYGRNHKMSQS